jgi:hypothetical protein
VRDVGEEVNLQQMLKRKKRNGPMMLGKQGFFLEGQILRQLPLTSKDVDPHARSGNKRDVSKSERL